MRRRGDAGGVGIGRKQFFFEKRTKKLLNMGMRQIANERIKVFFFFSSEKKAFVS
jgi:hypothetical protein